MIAVALVLSVVALGAPKEEGTPYDPASNGQLGTKALVALLESFGAQVTITDTQPTDTTDIVLALPSQVAPEQEDGLRRWVRRGHTLVTTDPRSDLTATRGSQASVAGFGETLIDRRECTITALQGVKTLRVDGGARFNAPDGVGRCFTRQGDAFVVSVPEGEGQIVSLGSATALVNVNLGSEDDAVLATALLAPKPGTRVAIMRLAADRVVATRSLAQVLGIGWKFAALQLVLAFGLYSLFRGRRLGHPIAEPQPVLIAGSELVNAVGNLLQQTKDPSRAAAILRGDLRRTLADRLGLPPQAPPELIADTAAQRAGADSDRVRSAITDHPVADEVELLAIATLVDEVREEILHGRSR